MSVHTCDCLSSHPTPTLPPALPSLSLRLFFFCPTQASAAVFSMRIGASNPLTREAIYRAGVRRLLRAHTQTCVGNTHVPKLISVRHRRWAHPHKYSFSRSFVPSLPPSLPLFLSSSVYLSVCLSVCLLSSPSVRALSYTLGICR